MVQVWGLQEPQPVLPELERLAVPEATRAVVQTESRRVQVDRERRADQLRAGARDMKRSIPPFSSPSQSNSTRFASRAGSSTSPTPATTAS